LFTSFGCQSIVKAEKEIIFELILQGMATRIKFETVDQYIDSLADADRQVLQLIRSTILAAAPDAKEIIHYQIPALAYGGEVFIYFAAFKNHIHITIPHPRSIFEAFPTEFAALEISKSTIRLTKDKPLPINLLQSAVKLRMSELNNH